jgi:hypothetical protein
MPIQNTRSSHRDEFIGRRGGSERDRKHAQAAQVLKAGME